MIAPRADFPLSTGACHIPSAVLVRAKVGTTFLNALLFRGFRRVEWRIWASWVAGDIPGCCKGGEVVGSIPIIRPFPDIASHVVKAGSIDGKGFHRGHNNKSVFPGVLHRKCSLVGIDHEFSAGFEFITPGIQVAGPVRPELRGRDVVVGNSANGNPFQKVTFNRDSKGWKFVRARASHSYRRDFYYSTIRPKAFQKKSEKNNSNSVYCLMLDDRLTLGCWGALLAPEHVSRRVAHWLGEGGVPWLQRATFGNEFSSGWSNLLFSADP